MTNLPKNDRKTSHEAGDKKKSRHSFLAILFSVFVALVLWFYVQDAEAPDYTKSFNSIPLKIQSLSSNFSVLRGGEGPLDQITLVGKRSTLNKIKAGDLEAYLDLRSVNQAGEYEIEVQVMLPEGTELADCFPQKYSLFVDETVSREIDISVDMGSYHVADNTQVIATPAAETVSVKGPKTVLDRIESAKVITGDLGEINASFERNMEYAFYDKNGEKVESRFIVAPEKNVKVKFSAVKSRTVPLTVEGLDGYWAQTDMKYTVTPSAVIVKGEPALVDALNGIPAVKVDETKLDSNRYSATLQPSQIHLPEGIALGETVGNINVVMELLDNVSTTFEIDLMSPSCPMSLTAPANGLDFKYVDESFTFKIRGKSATIATADVDDFFLNIDMSNITAPGTVEVPVEIRTVGESKKYYPVGTYTVMVNVK